MIATETDQSPPKVLFPPRSLQMTCQEEQDMVSYFIERANYWRGEMGWSTAGGYERSSWLWKRNAYTRMFENDFKHRAVQGSIFDRVNLSLGKIATFIEQHKSRIVADMLAGDKFFGTSPEGPEDAQEVIEDVERVLQDSATRQKLLEMMKLATKSALIRGEVVPKIVKKVEMTKGTRKVRVLMSGPEEQRDSRGELITSLDRWEVHPDNPALQYLVRDPRVTLPAEANIKEMLSQKEVEIPAIIAQTMGGDFSFPHWADLIIPPTATSVDAAEIKAQIFQLPWMTVMDSLPIQYRQSPAALDYIAQVRTAGASEHTTEKIRAVVGRGEKNDLTASTHERAYKERTYMEIYGKYDVTNTGRYEDMALLVDVDLQHPIYYGPASEVLSWTTRNHPFAAPIRIFPLEDRWYGQGYYEKYGEKSGFVDKCWCRIELELQRSGNLLIENREASLNAKAGKPLQFRTMTTIQTAGQFQPSDVLHVVTVEPQTEGIAAAMTTMVQAMEMEVGLSNPADASQGSAAADTLGAIQIMDAQKSVALREREGELSEGMNAAIVSFAEAELHGALDLTRIAALLDAKSEEGAPLPQVLPAKAMPPPMPAVGHEMAAPGPVPAQELPPPPVEAEMMTGMQRAERMQAWAVKNSKGLHNVLKVYVSNASSPTQRIQQSNEVIRIVDKWLAYDPAVRPNLWDTFANLLRDLGQKNPEKLLGPKNPPPMPTPPVIGPSPDAPNQNALA